MHATPLSKEITSHTRAVALPYCQSSAQVLEKMFCKPVSQCHTVTPTGTRDPGTLARTIRWLLCSTSFPPNFASGFYSAVGGMVQNPTLTFEKIFHV